jgi:hypothetical protein
MDDTAPQENAPQDSNAPERRPNDKAAGTASGGAEPLNAFNKIDLTQLQGFSFGTQWTQDKGGAAGGQDRGDPRPRRDDRRPGPGDGPDRRDRRAFRRPDGAPSGAPSDAPRGPDRPDSAARRAPDDRRPRYDSRDRPAFPPGRGAPHDRAPYESPHFTISFYPEDTSFAALVKTIRASCRTIELFEIARTVLGKAERFSVVVARKTPVSAGGPGPSTGGKPAAEGTPPSEPAAEAPGRPPLFISVPDALPFESENEALEHVFQKHLNQFFDLAEAEIEPPKGNFQVINRCGVTGELLGPPNYHRYAQIVQQHYAAKNLRMPFEAYRSRIETVRDPEVVNQWLEKMKKVTRYTWKVPGAPSAAPAPAPVSASAPAPAEGEAADPVAAPADTAAPAAPTAPAARTFDSFEDARSFVLTEAREKLVRPAGQARFHGHEIESLPPGEIRRAVEGGLERQRRFPLDTANALRGRLRREHFTIFKKGAKGISYVCAVKRKFRIPGQSFAESIGSLLAFIEAHAMVKAGELVRKFLGVADEGPDAPLPTVEQREKIAKLQGDLLWLVREGYVTEFIDGSLFAPPPMVEARKKEVEHEEHDPENFPEAPAPEPTAAAPTDTPAAPAPAETAPVPEAPAPAAEPPAAEASVAPETPPSA